MEGNGNYARSSATLLPVIGRKRCAAFVAVLQELVVERIRLQLIGSVVCSISSHMSAKCQDGSGCISSGCVHVPRDDNYVAGKWV